MAIESVFFFGVIVGFQLSLIVLVIYLLMNGKNGKY